MTDQTAQNPFLAETRNATAQGILWRDNRPEFERLKAEADRIMSARQAEEADVGRLLSALSRLDPAAGQAAREAWLKAKAGRQA